MTFDHVTNELIRDLCEGTIAPDRYVLAYATGYTSKAAEIDADNPDVPFDVLAAREIAADEASDAFDAGDNKACLEAIRAFWSN